MAAQVTFGVKGGANFAYMSIEEGMDYAFHVGAFSKITISDNFFIQPEVLFSKKGTMPTDLSYYQLECTFDYLSLPILIGWNVSDHLAIMTGPELSYLLNGTAYTLDDQIFISSAEFASWDVAIDFGLAYRISKKFSAEIRYSLGLVDVLDIMFEDLFYRPAGSIEEGKNRTIQLSANFILSRVKSKE